MIHVVIIEDIKEIREGLQILIDSSEGFSCNKTFASAEQAIAELPGSCPDVALMDIHLPGINGIEAVKKLKLQCPSTQFIMMYCFLLMKPVVFYPGCGNNNESDSCSSFFQYSLLKTLSIYLGQVVLCCTGNHLRDAPAYCR